MLRFAGRLGAAARIFVLALLVLPSVVHSQSVECDPGDKEVMGLTFRGNHAFSSGDLAVRVNTTASSWARRHLRFLGTRRCLDSSELTLDVYRLRIVYRNAGYYFAAVDTSVTAVGADAVKVAFIIREGPPIIVDSASITGLDSVPDRGDILKGLDLGVGKPFDRVHFDAVADSVVSRLNGDGYPKADVLRSFNADTAVTHRASVSFTVVPGPREHYGKITFSVQAVSQKKSPEIDTSVVKKLLGIRPGALYRDRDLISAQRNVYATGAYRHVEVAPLPDSLQPPGDTAMDLRVNLVEDYMRQLDNETGWATLDCFRQRDVYTDKNFLGEAKRFQLTGSLSKIGYGSWNAPNTSASRKAPAYCYKDLEQDPFSQALNYYLGATLTQPALFGTSAVPSYSVYRERRGEFKAYLRTTLIGGAASVTKNIGQRTTPFTLGYNLEYGKTDADPALLCAVFQRCDAESQAQMTQVKRLAIANAVVARVRTNSVIDPTEGTVLRAELRSSSNLIGSDPALTFNKGVLDGSWYHSLGGTKVVMIRLRSGAIVGGATTAGGSVRLPPPQERLYAGGANSVRGYSQNELGGLIYLAAGIDSVHTASPDTVYLRIKGDSLQSFTPWIPTGGNALLIANFEYRVRDVFFPRLVQYTFFTDAGEVWTPGPGESYLGFQNLKWTPGIGVRYFSPVGPIQLNVGYNPYRRPAGPVYYYNLSHGNTQLYCVSPDNTLPVVNGKQAPGACSSAYTPPERNNFFRKLTLTVSFGPDF